MDTHVFEVRPSRLKEFMQKANEYDSMGGNKIERIDLHGDKYVVVVRREFSYPFVINELRKLETQ